MTLERIKGVHGIRSTLLNGTNNNYSPGGELGPKVRSPQQVIIADGDPLSLSGVITGEQEEHGISDGVKEGLWLRILVDVDQFHVSLTVRDQRVFRIVAIGHGRDKGHSGQEHEQERLHFAHEEWSTGTEGPCPKSRLYINFLSETVTEISVLSW